MEEKQSRDANNAGYSCPICLGGDQEEDVIVIGPCRHEFCLPCVQRVLSAPTPRQTRQPSIVPSEDEHMNVPTLGQCPICRSELSLFTMKEKDKQGQGGGNAIPKMHDIDKSDLAGKVFVKERTKVGKESFHFPPYQNDDGDDDEVLSPFLNLSENQWRFDGGTSVPDKIYFDEGCHFHEQTRTFHGSISWDRNDDCRKRIRGSHRWDYVLAFASDYRFIARGVLIARKQVCNSNDCSKLECKFPMDGRWKVDYPDSKVKPSTVVDVHGNRIQFQPALLDASDQLSHRLDFSGEYPAIVWGDREDRQIASSTPSKSIVESSLEVVEWEAKYSLGLLPKYPRMIWKRETMISENVPLQVVQFGPGNVYQCMLPNSPNGTFASEYVPGTVWGNTFGQGLSVGLASYHFMGDSSGAYISYEHEDTSMWPPLDNGSPVPTKMWFSNYTFDEESRIFRGHIDWEATHNTTWQGSSVWRYEMRFSEDYSTIIGGQCISIRGGSSEESEMGSFGVRLVYINIGLLEKISIDSGHDAHEHRRRLEELADRVRGQIEVEPNAAEEAMIRITRIRAVIMSSSHIPISYPSTFL